MYQPLFRGFQCACITVLLTNATFGFADDAIDVGVLAESKPGAIVIQNTGSTNTSGFRIELMPDGEAHYVMTARRFPLVRRLERGQLPGQGSIPAEIVPSPGTPKEASGKISPSLVQKIFADLKQTMPLTQYPATHCMKSASFGFEYFVKYQGQQSPDLACPIQDKRMRALLDDADQVAHELHVK